MFLKLLILGYLIKYGWIILTTPKYLITWIIFSLVPPYFCLHRSKHLKVSKELELKYDAFYRTDMKKRNYSIVTLISLFTFLPRYLIAWWAILTYTTLIMLIMMGTSEQKPIEPWRYNLVSLTVKPFARIHMWMSGIIKVNYQENA